MDPQEEEIIADSEDEGHGGMRTLERAGDAESPASSALLAAIGSAHADSLATPHINSVVYHQHPRPASALSNQSSVAMSSTTMTVHYDASVTNKWDAAPPLPPIAVLPQRSSLSPLSDPPSPITKVASPSAHASDHSSSATNPSSKLRPKPRPIKAKTITPSDNEAHPAVESMTVDPSYAIHANNDLFSLSLAERAKLRSRKAKSNTSDMQQDEEAPPPPSTETTNSGSSKRKRDVEKAATLEVIDLSSDDEDELSLRPSAKRQKSPIQRDAVVGATTGQDPTELVSGFPSSPLPPSDIPVPTSTATTTDVHFQHMPPEPIFAPPPLLIPSRNRNHDSSVTATETVPVQMIEVVMPSLPYERPGKTSNANKGKKAKQPSKSKSKKSAKKDTPENDGGGDDANYNNAAPKSSRAKGKGKKKTAGDEIEFKSNEVVADSDEEGDFLDIKKSISSISSDGPVHGASVGQAIGSESTAEGEDSSILSKRKGGKTAKSRGKKAVTNPPQVDDENSASPFSNNNNPTSTIGKTVRNRNVIFSDDEDELAAASLDNLPKKTESHPSTKAKQPKKGRELKHSNISPDDDEDYDLAKQKSSNNSRSASPVADAKRSPSPTPGAASPPARKTAPAPTPQISSRSYSISSKQRSTPMSELLKRVNSMPSSPFAQSTSKSSKPSSSIYSPLLKNSRSALSRIAPLHPNRRTPPPPPPRIPPPPKSKKQIALEEKWMEELEESVEGWSCLPEDEKTALWKAKYAKEMGYDD